MIIIAAVSGPDIVAHKLDVDVTAIIRWNRHDLETDHCSGGRIGAMRGIRYEDLRPTGLASLAMIGTGDQDARQFTMGAGRRLQRNRGKSGNLCELLPATRTSAQVRLEPRTRADRDESPQSPEVAQLPR